MGCILEVALLVKTRETEQVAPVVAAQRVVAPPVQNNQSQSSAMSTVKAPG